MPPFVPRKRQFSPEPTSSPVPSRHRGTPKSDKKSSLWTDIDAPSTAHRSAADTKKLIESLNDDDDDGDSSLSEVDSDEFEDVPPVKRQKTGAANGRKDADEEGEVDDDEMDWEDAIGESKAAAAGPTGADVDIGDISISLNEDGSYVEPTISLATGKKGPSKRERQMRSQTHCLHVLSLLWHNTVRNSWLNDKELQRILVEGLPDGVKREVRRWREAMGTLSKEELAAKKRKSGGRGRSSGNNLTNGRDWNYDAEHLEQGVPNLSRGDPLLRLLKVLTAYWRKRFLITAPALRKHGYKPLRRLRDEIRAWEKDKQDLEHGERIENREALRELAKKAEGSRDVGAQLFVALLRGLGIETRMVSNLQPAGLSFNMKEEANEKTKKEGTKKEDAKDEESSTKSTKKSTLSSRKQSQKLKPETPIRKSQRGDKARPISLDDSESSLSDPPSDPKDGNVESDDDLSVVDITPAPRKRPSIKYDRDMAYPNYWAEVCSPVSHKFIPVDPIVLSTIASTDDLLQTFEPRGMKADKAKQVICYTVAYASDGSAKDVTVRYLKRHQLPGKTKGVRMPVEKIPIHNSRGKVKKYEDFDWFASIMLMYRRPDKQRTAADDREEQTDLKPFKPEKEAKEVEKESLQWYKQSAEFVLEEHLRREEALLPGAKPVKTFVAGKGDKAREHPVYLRKDVVACKTSESWHKEGRAVIEGAQPRKYVPVRAVTLGRKREMEEALRETGERLQQGLYAKDQTDWIIPPPIENGVIPKNAFGNIDVYVPSMVPAGAVHLPLKGSAKLCRRLEIDYAEACTGFEFGKQRAVPVLTGVVVAEKHATLVRDAWRADQAEQRRKEDVKRAALSLHWWRKMLMGLRIIARMQAEYTVTDGGAPEAANPFVRRAQREGRDITEKSTDEEEYAGPGGFLPPGHEDEEVRKQQNGREGGEDFGGGFLVDDENAADATEGGGFLVEDGSDGQDDANTRTAGESSLGPRSLQSLHHSTYAQGQNNEDVDGEEELDSDPSVPMSQRRKSTPKKQKGKATPVSRRRQVAKEPSDSDDLSELSESPDEYIPPANTTTKGKAKQVKGRQSASKARSGKPAASSRRVSTRATARKSRYFAGSDSDEEDDGDDDNDDDEDDH